MLGGLQEPVGRCFGAMIDRSPFGLPQALGFKHNLGTREAQGTA